MNSYTRLSDLTPISGSSVCKRGEGGEHEAPPPPALARRVADDACLLLRLLPGGHADGAGHAVPGGQGAHPLHQVADSCFGSRLLFIRLELFSLPMYLLLPRSRVAFMTAQIRQSCALADPGI